MINDHFSRIEEFKKNVKHAKTIKDIINPKNFLFYIASDFETKLWLEAYNALNERFPQIYINSYEYDGFKIQLPKSNAVVAPEIIEFLNDLCKNFGISWARKPFNENTEIETTDPEVITTSDQEEATPLVMLDTLLETENDYIKNINDTIFIFDKKTGMWVKEGLGIFMNMCADNFGRDTLYGGSPRYIKDLWYMCKTLPDATDWFLEARKNRLGKLLYSNGIVNIETGTFEDFNCNYFFGLLQLYQFLKSQEIHLCHYP
jgi:hypothetical protein